MTPMGNERKGEKGGKNDPFVIQMAYGKRERGEMLSRNSRLALLALLFSPFPFVAVLSDVSVLFPPSNSHLFGILLPLQKIWTAKKVTCFLNLLLEHTYFFKKT